MDALLAYWDRDPISFSIIAVVLAAVLAVALTNLRTPKQIYFNIDSAVDKLCLFLNVVAATWIMMMAWVILVDVVSLAMRRPIEGAREIIALSVITILFLQIPLAIRHGGMIRTTIVYDNVGPKTRDAIDVVSYFLGVIFFVAIAVGGWHNMVLGFYRQELEFIGRGSLPLWAFRYVVVWFSVLAALIYVLMIVNIFVKPASERDASQRGETEVVID